MKKFTKNKLFANVISWFSIYEFTIGYTRIESEDDTLLNGKKNKVFHCLKPKGLKEWYADPFIIEKNSRTYVFMELFDEKEKKGKIAYSEIIEESGFTEPKIVIEEEWHLSFPFIFEYGGKMYMMPECRHAGHLILYSCECFPDYWVKCAESEDMDDVVDSVIIKRGHEMVILMSYQNADNRLYTRQMLGKILFDNNVLAIDTEQYRKANTRRQFTLYDRNGGAPVADGNAIYRVAQESSEDIYGAAVRFYKITRLDKESFEEKLAGRIGCDEIKTDLPDEFLFRGIHTYGKTEHYEVIDINTARMKYLFRRFIAMVKRKLGG